MLIRMDPASERAIYEQIADSVRAGIAAGRVRVGETLPPARELAAGLEVNQHTVLHAYQLLRDEGLVDLRRGRGAVVTPLAAAVAELYREAQALAAHAAALGVAPAALAALIAGTGLHEVQPAPGSPPPGSPPIPSDRSAKEARA
ncbi:MAG: GntR family transcriptional regulator [Leucobacter sp.]